jgi:uncharacterized protein YjbI with pentapeptide repeats/DNA-binding NarL/FixJ family response regulator
MRHHSLESGKFDWTKVRLIIYSQDDQFRFLIRSTFRKVAIAEVLSTSVAADITPFMKQHGPDVALLDMESDPVGALAALAAIRAVDKDMPVLVAANAGKKDQVAQARDLGIEGVVPKPISGHELAHRIEAALLSPQRMAPEQRVVRAPVILQKQAAVDNAVAAPVAMPANAAAGQAVKAELSRLTARLGPAVVPRSGGGGGGASGGSLGGGSVAGKIGAGKIAGGRFAADDVPAATKPGSAGTYGDDGIIAAAPAKRASGTYGDDMVAAPAKKTAPLEVKAPPEDAEKRQRAAEAKAAKAAKAKAEWEESLAEAGHTERHGADVAAFDVTTVIASHLKWLETKGTEGSRANLEGKDLAGVDLARTVLAAACLRRADLSDANLAEARLDGADLRYATLSASNCTSAVMGVAQLRHADMRLANLEGASLRGADLSGARLGGARLGGADFDGAILVETDLCEADLSKVENLKQSQIDKAIGDSSTRLPPGLRLRPVDRMTS